MQSSVGKHLVLAPPSPLKTEAVLRPNQRKSESSQEPRWLMWVMSQSKALTRTIPAHNGSKQLENGTANITLYYELGSGWVSERAKEWAQHSARVKQTSKRTSEPTSEWPSAYVPIWSFCKRPCALCSQYALKYARWNIKWSKCIVKGK